MIRTVSVSEVGALMDCEAKHAFAYTGHLTGGNALKPKDTAINLRRGRAWGAGVAAWHATDDMDVAIDAMRHSLDEDAMQQEAAGVYIGAEHLELSEHLISLLEHYTAEAERMPLTNMEMPVRVSLPSRTGRRISNRYHFEGYLDGLTRDADGRLWIVEFKLRGRLSSFEHIAWLRQVRWYAWAAEKTLGEPVQGVIVDERLNETPKPARILQSGKPSHAKDQATTAALYVAACAYAGEEPKRETIEALEGRRWQARHTVLLRRDEIHRAKLELVSAARLVGEMDAGDRFPVANPSPFRCPGCAYREVCPRPGDDELIDANFDRIVPKRHRPHEERPVSALPLFTTTREEVAA